MQLTDEQKHAVDMALTGQSMALEALAGTGKTTTLKVIAEQKPEERGLYVAFNKAIAKEAASKFPDNTEARTLHSLAYAQVMQTDPWFMDRMGSNERLKSGKIAAYLDIGPLVVPHWSGSGGLRLAPGRLAGYTMRMVRNFCTTGDAEPSAKHMPRIEGLDKDGEWTVHNMIGDWLELPVQKAWEDLTSSKGKLPFDHGTYLKMFQLMKPSLQADFLLIDEAQDLNPLMSAILTTQTEAQIIAVGDARQQIYEWNGAINALEAFSGNRAWLTKSFRFGPEIAEVANYVLHEMLDEEVQIEGLGPAGTVTVHDRCDAFLTRRNSTALRRAAFEIQNGRKVHIEGGGKDISSFAYAALDVMAGRFCTHPELACFESWEEVCEYVDDDELGGDLSSMVALVNEIGAPRIIDIVKGLVRKNQADMVISTAHKSKGLEWADVSIARDMVRRTIVEGVESYDPGKMGSEDKRLLYVAITRAESSLDVSELEPLQHFYRPMS